MRFLQTLGHLEKAVVLELTLKHVKALTSLLEQQQQKILALQNGMQIGELQITRTHTYLNVHMGQDGCGCQNANLRQIRQISVRAVFFFLGGGALKCQHCCTNSRFPDVTSCCFFFNRAASCQPGKVRGDVPLWLPHVCQGDSSVSSQS